MHACALITCFSISRSAMSSLLVQDFGKAGAELAEHVVGGQGVSIGGGRNAPVQAKVPRGSRLHQIVEWLKGGEGDPLIVSHSCACFGVFVAGCCARAACCCLAVQWSIGSSAFSVCGLPVVLRFISMLTSTACLCNLT